MDNMLILAVVTYNILTGDILQNVPVLTYLIG